MSVFTDEDLKRLKDCANGYGEHHVHIFGHCFEKRIFIESLLERMKAAEIALECHSQSGDKFYEAWRKAAGK